MSEIKSIQIHYADGSQRTCQESLYLCYLPLVKADAILLYQVCWSLGEIEIEPKNLEILSGLTRARIDKALTGLEMYGLADLWENFDQTKWQIDLLKPRPVMEFLRHEIYGRMFLDAAGSNRYDQLILQYTRKKPEGGWTKRNSSIDPEYLEARWNEEKEERLQISRAKSDTTDFDWQKFYQGFDTQLPMRMRTRDNEECIAGLSRLYGMDEEQMRRYVIRACPRPARILDKKLLENMLLNSRQEGRRLYGDDPYDMSPVIFLQKKQNGMAVARPDRKLLDDLASQTGFDQTVLNRMVEYILDSTGQQFGRSLSEKIAATWVRNGIDSAQKADEWIQNGSGKARMQKQNAKPAAQLPDWYADTGEDGPTDDLLKEIEEMRKGKLG